MRPPGALLVVAGIWLTVLVGLLTNLVTDEFPLFLEPVKPWLGLLLLAVGSVLTVVELRRGGSLRLLGDPVAKPRDRTAALRRIRARITALLGDALDGVDPLVLRIEGAESVAAAYETDESLVVLGAAGSGKSTELLRLAAVLARRAGKDDDDKEPLPVVLSLAGWGRQRRRPRLVDLIVRTRRDEEPEALLDWLLARAFTLYRIPPVVAREWLRGRGVVLMLDGLDEVRTELRARCVSELNQLLEDPNKPFVVVSCRTTEYQALRVKPRLRRTVTVAPLSPEQVSRHLNVPLDDELRKIVDTPLWLRVAKVVSGRLDTDAGSDELRRHLLDAYVTELLDRRGGDRTRLLRQLGLLTRLARHTADPDGVDLRVLNGRNAPVAAELVAALRTWVVPPALAAVLVTGLVLPLVLWFGVVVGVAAALSAVLAALIMGLVSDVSRYAVNPVADRPWRGLLGALAGLMLGVGVGGLCAVVSGALATLPDGWRTVALGAVVGVAGVARGGGPKVGAALGASAVTGLALWWMGLTDPDFQHILLVAVIGLTGCVAVVPILLHGDDTRDTANRNNPGRLIWVLVVVTAVLAAGVIAAAGVAGVPVDGPLGAAVGGLFLAVLPGLAVAASTGGALGMVLAPIVHRAGLAWTGLLPVRLRPFLRESARRGLVTATEDGCRFLHVLLREHVTRIDVLDGRPSGLMPALAARERETVLARLGSLLGARARPRGWIALRLREDGSDEPLTDANAAERAFAAADGTLALLGRVGSGTSTLLLDIAEALLAQARADPRRPVPVLLDLNTVPSRIEPVDGVVRPFTRWVVAQSRARYGITTETMLAWLADRRVVLLLDGHGQGAHAARNAAMVEEFLNVYDVAAVVVGWTGGPPPPRRSTTVTVEPLTRDEVRTALAGHPCVLDFLGDDGQMWAALDTVDRVRLVTEAASATDPGESYVDGRFDGLPAAARSWYAGLTGKTDADIMTAVRLGLLLPAVMVAVTLRFGLGPASAVAAGLVTGLLERPPLVKPMGRVAGLAVAVVLGFALSMLAHLISNGMTIFEDLPTTPAAAGIGLVFGVGVLLMRKVLLLFPFVVAMYLLFNGPARIGPPWAALVDVGHGALLGGYLAVMALFVLVAFSPLLGAWAGVRPWRRRRRKGFERDLIARRLVVRNTYGLHAADPLVERVLAAQASR